MPRGRPRTPRKILEMRKSSALRQPLHRDSVEPEPPLGVPVCPDWLDDVAKEKWNDLVPLLDQMGILSRIDGDAIAAYCQTWARFLRAERELARTGDVFVVDKRITLSPYLRILRDALATLHRYQIEFGLTAAARARLSVPSNMATDPMLVEFFRRNAPQAKFG